MRVEHKDIKKKQYVDQSSKSDIETYITQAEVITQSVFNRKQLVRQCEMIHIASLEALCI